jgi:protein tyrosine/serine phosphatase
MTAEEYVQKTEQLAEEYMKTDEYKEEHDAQKLLEVENILVESLVTKLALIREKEFYKAKAEWERARVYKAWEDNPEKRNKLAYTKYWRQ